MFYNLPVLPVWPGRYCGFSQHDEVEVIINNTLLQRKTLKFVEIKYITRIWWSASLDGSQICAVSIMTGQRERDPDFCSR